MHDLSQNKSEEINIGSISFEGVEASRVFQGVQQLLTVLGVTGLVLDLRAVNVMQTSLSKKVCIKDTHDLPTTLIQPNLFQPANSIGPILPFPPHILYKYVDFTWFQFISFLWKHFLDQGRIFKNKRKDSLDVIFGDIFGLIPFFKLRPFHFILTDNISDFCINFWVVDIVRINFKIVVWVHNAININAVTALGQGLFFTNGCSYNVLFNSVDLCMFLALGIIGNNLTLRDQHFLIFDPFFCDFLIRNWDRYLDSLVRNQ